MPILTFSRDGVVQQQASLEKDVTTLGRLDDNDIVLRDGSISRHHAQIERRGNQFIIKDLGSQNGIWVGGARVSEAELNPGVPLVIGVFTATFDAGAGGYAAAAPPAFAAGFPSAAKLFVLDGPMLQQEFPLNRPEIRLGRSSVCEIPIDHEAVSKNHARIVFQNNQFVLSDTGSRNGVFVNGLRINTHTLRHGDEIEVGPVRFAFSETGEYIAPSAPGYAPPPAAAYAPLPGVAAGKKSLFTRLPKTVWIAGGAAIVIIVILVALVSGPPKAGGPSAKELGAENQQTIQKLLTEGKQYFAAGDFQGALEKANAVLVPELDPTNREAMDLQARAQEKLREQATARVKAEQEAAERAAKVQALFNDATAAFKANNFEEATAKLNEARLIEPDEPNVKKLLGDTFVAIAKAAVKKRDYKSAYEAYDDALETDPNNAEARKGRDSVGNYEQAVKAREARTNSLFGEAKRALDRGDSVKAYRDLTQVLDMNPNYPQAANLRNQLQSLLETKAKPFYDEGVRLFNAGQTVEAMRKLNQALEVFPDHAPTQQFIAQARNKLRQEAQEAFRRGYIAEGLGKYREALDWYQKALNLLPDPNEEYHKKAADKIAEVKGKAK